MQYIYQQIFQLSSPSANGEQETNGHENGSDNQIKGGLALGSLQVSKKSMIR